MTRSLWGVGCVSHFLWRTCVPDTGPIHVVPVYGTVIVFPVSCAVPVSEIPHVRPPELVAVPFAVHCADVGPVSVPLAVPAYAVPLQVALNDPDALVDVFVAAVHWKLVQVFGSGMMPGVVS